MKNFSEIGLFDKSVNKVNFKIKAVFCAHLWFKNLLPLHEIDMAHSTSIKMHEIILYLTWKSIRM